MTEYIHRYFVFVQWDKLTPANAQAKAWDPDTGGELTFGGVRLSADGQEPPTYSACNTAATDTMRTKILAAFTHVPFYNIYLAVDGWTWETALDDAGLQVIEGEGVV
ncbi:MAG TPA: hypothetical protein ENI05_02740 [Porticoccus sp.]|nr:hypothetical protein [Porticoccus sp.]